jgi:rsbT co-antagonist protein RsbR
MPNSEIEQLRDELEKSRQRLADVEARLAAEMAARASPSWLDVTLDMADVGVWEWDITLDKVTWTEAVYRLYGITREMFDGTLNAVVAATFAEDRDILGAMIQDTLATGRPYQADYRIVRSDGSIRWVAARGQALRDERGKPYRLAGTVLDVTDRKREAAESLAMQQRIIDAQDEALRELGAPIIPLADQTLAVPLVGILGRGRAEQVNEVLLRAVREHSAQMVLLDVTGVPSVDISAAQALLGAARAVGLLGARVVLTGVRPQVAQTLVELGIDMQTFVIKANLQSGIEYAARSRRRGKA